MQPFCIVLKILPYESETIFTNVTYKYFETAVIFPKEQFGKHSADLYSPFLSAHVGFISKPIQYNVFQAGTM